MTNPVVTSAPQQSADAPASGPAMAQFCHVDPRDIAPNPRQPRQVFDEEGLAELTESVKELGLLQPLVVRRRGAQTAPASTQRRLRALSDPNLIVLAADQETPDAPADLVHAFVDVDVNSGLPVCPEYPLTQAEPSAAGYELVMGERRLRAALAAGLATVPVIVKQVEDADLLRDALVENIHRAQLNPLEEAAAYVQLLQDFDCTHEELARRLRRSRTAISSAVSLLRLPVAVQRRVAAGVLTVGHAKALTGVRDPGACTLLAQRIVAEGLSVRATEEIIALGDLPGLEGELPRRPRSRGTAASPQAYERLADHLCDRLDTRVRVVGSARRGRIVIDFAGEDDLGRILDALARASADGPESLLPGT